jgi:oxygen-independent coproporphyrinogen-3 oxidase
VSIGVQSLDEDGLAFLGRWHSPAEAIAAVTQAARFPRHSFDLIYGLPGQTVAGWKAALARALEMAGDHLSVYQLTVEPGTAFFTQGVKEAPEGLAAALYEATQEALDGAGLPAYEISNHARPGAECRHNLFIWRGGDYVGIGPGAHGRKAIGGGGAWSGHRIAAPERWLQVVESRGHGTAKTTRLSPQQRREEIIMTGLRLTAGIGTETFAEAAGQSLADTLDESRIKPLAEGGFIEWDGRILRATASGRLRLNAVIGKLLA